MTFLLNFIKIYQLVQKLLGGGGEAHIDRQTGDLISLIFLFKESRLIIRDYRSIVTSSVLQPLLSEYNNGGLLRCDTECTFRWVPTFRRNILPPPSGLMVEAMKMEAVCFCKTLEPISSPHGAAI
jgi:hypothetical protein